MIYLLDSKTASSFFEGGGMNQAGPVGGKESLKMEMQDIEVHLFAHGLWLFQSSKTSKLGDVRHEFGETFIDGGFDDEVGNFTSLVAALEVK